MQNAGQFGPGTASVHPPSTQFAQSEPSPTGGSTTSSLRQFRKKDAEKNHLDQQPTKPMSESHVARVAPHNHYPPPASNDVYRYSGHQFAGYRSDTFSPGQVKYSDLAEASPPNPISTSVIQKPKSKEYMEMCNVEPQQHLNNHPQYSPDNGQYMHKDPTQSYPSGFKPTESHFFPKDQHQYQQMAHHAVQTKYNAPMMAQNMRKYNSAPADNPFLDKLSKIHPSMARSIMSDHHLQNPQGFPPMDQRGMYPQQNHRYYPGAMHQGNPYAPNPNYPMNSPHTYSNYASSSCSYPRSAQMGPVGARYAPMERSLSPSRRPYPETMHSPHINYHQTMHQKIPSGSNYPQYARAPEYAQHYQHRRMPQDYYAQGCRPGQYIQGHHQMTGQEMQEMQNNTVSPSDSLKKFIENWADEEPLPEINPMDPNLRDKLRDDAPGTVYMINPNDLQYFENNGIPIVTSDNGGFHMTSENYQNLLKNGLVDNTAIVRIIESNKDNPSDNQDRVVNLQIMETSKSDCMLANKQLRPSDGTAFNPEDSNRRVVIHQNTIIASSINDKSNPDQNMPLVDNNNSITKELVDKNCSPINLDHLDNLGFSEPPETENAKDSNISPDDLSSSIDISPDGNKSMPIIDFFAEAAVVNHEENKGDMNEEEEAENFKSTAPNFNTVIVAPEIRADSAANSEDKFEPEKDCPSEPDRRKRIFSVDDIMHNIGNNSRRNSDTISCSHQAIKEFIEREIAYSSLEQLRCRFHLIRMKMKNPKRSSLPQMDESRDHLNDLLKKFLQREIAFSSLEQLQCHSHLMKIKVESEEQPGCNISSTLRKDKEPDELEDFIKREIAFSSSEQFALLKARNMQKPQDLRRSNIEQMETSTTMEIDIKTEDELGNELKVFIEREIAFSSLEQMQCHFHLMKTNLKNMEKSAVSTSSNIIRVEGTTTLLELAGELMEITVNIVNGRKVINVTPLSNSVATVDVNDNYEVSLATEESNQSGDLSNNFNEPSVDQNESEKKLVEENVGDSCQNMDVDESLAVVEIFNEASDQASPIEEVTMHFDFESSVTYQENVEDTDKSSIKDNEASVEDLSAKALLTEEPEQSEIVQDTRYALEVYNSSSNSVPDSIKSTTSDDDDTSNEQSKEEIATGEKHEEINDNGPIANEENIEESKAEDLSIEKTSFETREENNCLASEPILHNESTELKVENLCEEIVLDTETTKSEVKNEMSEILAEDELKTESASKANLINDAVPEDYNQKTQEDDKSLSEEFHESKSKNINEEVEVIVSRSEDIETESKSAENKDEVVELNDNRASSDSLDPKETESEQCSLEEIAECNVIEDIQIQEDPLVASVFSEEVIELEVATVVQNTNEVFDFSINDRDHETLVDFPLEDEVFIADPPAHEVIVTDPLEGIGIIEERDIGSPQIPLGPITTTYEILVEEPITQAVIVDALENKGEIVKVAKSEIQILSPTSTNIEDCTTKNILQMRKYSTDNDFFDNICEFTVATKAAKKSYESDLQVQHDIVSSSNKDKQRISKRSGLKKSKRLNEKVQAKNEQKEKFKLLKERRKRKEELRQKSLKIEMNLEVKKKRKEHSEVVNLNEKSLPTEGRRQETKKKQTSKEELRQKSLSDIETKKSVPKLVIELEHFKEVKNFEKEKNKDPSKNDEEEYVDFKELLKARKLKKLKKLLEAKTKADAKEHATKIKTNSSEKLRQLKKLEKPNTCCIGCNSSSNKKEDQPKNKFYKKMTKNEEPVKVNEEQKPPKVETSPKVDVPTKSPIPILEKIQPKKRVSFSENTAPTPIVVEPKIQKMHPKDPRRRSKTFTNQVLAPSVSELIEENNGGASKKKISLADYVSRKRKASCTEIQPEKRPKLVSLDSTGYERSDSTESNNNTFENIIKEKSLSDIKTSFLIHSSDWEDSHSPPPPPEPEECLIEDFSGLIKNNSSKKPVIDVNELTLIENPKDKKLQEYKDKVDSQLSSLNIQIPKSKPLNRSPKSNSLVSRFLNNEKMSQSEIEEIKKIVSYKKAMQHPKNWTSPSKSLSVESFTNIKSPEAGSSSLQHFSTLEHSKKVNSKRKTVSDEDDEDSGSVSDGPKKSYSVFNRLGEDGLPKIILKRNIKCKQTKEPIVQLVNILDDMETVKKKYNVTVRQIM
ncbi:unnamed protein product [Ceutorhynchus assimilis]|uniref:Uncharacterized protein n=1 Tax=Ceutorhynchus assimilis TaxID=467358 RepID=A0A9N9MX49_9CUCU|nr:unnamed protein product [Ceutorhynchus assimilis]